MVNALYELQSRIKTDYVEVLPQWLEDHAVTALCPECKALAKDFPPQTFDVDVKWEPESVYAYIDPSGACAFRRTLIEQLSAHMRDHIVGKLSVAGRVSGRYVTCYPLTRKKIEIREGPGARYRTCGGCERQIIEWHAKNRYVLSRHIVGEHVFQDARGFVFMTEVAKASVNWSEFPDAKFAKIAVRESEL